jgi:hypothetical protein
MNDTNEQKHDNEHNSISDLDLTDEQAEQARAGDGSGFQSEYKYVSVRTFPK